MKQAIVPPARSTLTIRAVRVAASAVPPMGIARSGLTVESVHGQGTIVSLFLPGAASDAGQRYRAEPRQPQVGASRKNATILVVEDERRMRRLARQILSELGYQVLEAENAAAAALLLEKDVSVDLLFTDIVMPGAMDGRELGHWARKHRRGLKVLLTSGFPQEAPDKKVPGGETLPFLNKPYSKEQLQVAIQTLLNAQAS